MSLEFMESRIAQVAVYTHEARASQTFASSSLFCPEFRCFFVSGCRSVASNAAPLAGCGKRGGWALALGMELRSGVLEGATSYSCSVCESAFVTRTRKQAHALHLEPSLSLPRLTAQTERLFHLLRNEAKALNSRACVVQRLFGFRPPLQLSSELSVPPSLSPSVPSLTAEKFPLAEEFWAGMPLARAWGMLGCSKSSKAAA